MDACMAAQTWLCGVSNGGGGNTGISVEQEKAPTPGQGHPGRQGGYTTGI